MTASMSLTLLHNKVAKLLEKSLYEIQGHASQALSPCKGRFGAAEYLLSESREYVDGAFNLLEAGKPRASLTCSRWILEAALNLLWATAEPSEIDERLRRLAAEALRLEAARLEGLAKLYPGKTNRLLAQADKARKQMRALVGQGRCLTSLDTRTKFLKKRLDAKALPNPYALYRVCCDAAHPGLAVWRRFGLGPGGATVASSPPDSTQIAIWMVVASSFHLVAGAYCLTSLGDADSLKIWWEQEVASLLSCP